MDLQTRGPEAFQNLIDSLLVTEHLDLVRRLEPHIDIRSYFTKQLVPQPRQGYCLSSYIHLTCQFMTLCSVSEGINIFDLKIERNNLLWKFVFTQKPACWPNADHNVNVECGENLNCFVLVVLMKKAIPLQVWTGGLQGVEDSIIFRHGADAGGKVFSPTTGCLYLPGYIPGTHLY